MERSEAIEYIMSVNAQREHHQNGGKHNKMQLSEYNKVTPTMKKNKIENKCIDGNHDQLS